jgi:hypothetical protein
LNSGSSSSAQTAAVRVERAAAVSEDAAAGNERTIKAGAIKRFAFVAHVAALQRSRATVNGESPAAPVAYRALHLSLRRPTTDGTRACFRQSTYRDFSYPRYGDKWPKRPRRQQRNLLPSDEVWQSGMASGW